MKDQAILHIQFPFTDDVGGARERTMQFEAFYYNLFHMLLRRKAVVSLEISYIQGAIHFYIVCGKALAPSITSLIFADFSDAQMERLDQYEGLDKIPKQAIGFRIKRMGSEAYSLKTVGQGNSDPLSTFFNILSELPASDAVMFQIVLEPFDESIQEESGEWYWRREKMEATQAKPQFNTTVRLLYFTDEADEADHRITYFENAFSSFATERNYLRVSPVPDPQPVIDGFFQHRQEISGMFTTEEISGLYHSPDPDAKIRGVDWLYSRKAEPPMNLPTLKNTPEDEISIFGVTNFRGKRVEFGIRREDRRRHLYVVGKSGVGKSKLLEKLIGDDIRAGKGLCVIDPHGDLVNAMLYHVPENRIEDVVYFSPSDLDWPIAFNPLENVDREFKQQVTQGLIEIFKKFFGADWTPKIEHVFRFTVLALLDYKKATMMGMQKMLTDRPYRQMIIDHIQDQTVKKFWANEFSSWSEKFDNEAIVPLVNKLGQFLSNEMVRNIVAQPTNKVDFNDIMNNEKILLVELSKGKLGDENSALLGSLLITKIEQQGMARAFISQEERKDFYLYVDEFQNFATKTFDNILSEARKYRLDLTVSHQYLGQLLAATRDTVFGNVGSMISFRLSADDGAYLAKEFAPRFTSDDIMNLGVREMYVKMSISGMVTPAFSAVTVDVADPDPSSDLRNRILDASRSKFSTPVKEVEAEIEAMDEIAAGEDGGETAAAKAGPEDDFNEPVV